jgi:hypothetical protein
MSSKYTSNNLPLNSFSSKEDMVLGLPKLDNGTSTCVQVPGFVGRVIVKVEVEFPLTIIRILKPPEFVPPKTENFTFVKPDVLIAGAALVILKPPNPTV